MTGILIISQVTFSCSQDQEEGRQKAKTDTVVVDGKLKFRSHFTDAEKDTIKKVSAGKVKLSYNL